VTHPAASYDPPIRLRRPIALLAFAALVPAACGGSQKSTLPPSPGAGGAIALRYLAQDPEVYANAAITTVGTVVRVGGVTPPLYELDGGHGKRIVLEPAARAAPYAGRRVKVSGVFGASSFQLGYEIQVSRIRAGGSL
jgi:hypothetical protein